MIRLMYVAIITALLVGCSHYQIDSVKADGSTCSLRIISWREMETTGLGLSENCGLVGGTAGMKYNAEQMEAINSLIGKVP